MGLGASSAIHGLAFIAFGVTLSHPSFASLTALHPATPSFACRSSLKLLNPQFPGGSHPSEERNWKDVVLMLTSGANSTSCDTKITKLRD